MWFDFFHPRGGGRVQGSRGAVSRERLPFRTDCWVEDGGRHGTIRFEVTVDDRLIVLVEEKDIDILTQRDRVDGEQHVVWKDQRGNVMAAAERPASKVEAGDLVLGHFQQGTVTIDWLP
jgi:hypothetical protein